MDELAAKELQKNYQIVTDTISRACDVVGRDPASVQLIAVSKKQHASMIQKLYELTGHHHYGENFAQELRDKSAELQALPLQWHYLGKLQSNKTKYIAKARAVVHTVTRTQQLIELQKLGWGEDFFVQINLENEPQKSGISFDQLPLFADKFKKLDSTSKACWAGLMAIPPAKYCDEDFYVNVGDIPESYGRLVSASKQWSKQAAVSLGMSADLKLAIAAGSTHVRVGRAIFGERK